MQKRLLLISYFFHPEPLAGTIRPGALVKFLPEWGWEVDLVTRVQPSVRPNGKCFVVPHKPWLERLREDRGLRPDRWVGAAPLDYSSPSEGPARPSFSGSVYRRLRQPVIDATTFPDRAYNWCRPVRRVLSRRMSGRPPTAVLSTSPPEASHFIARWVQRTTNARWIADLRDPWGNAHSMNPTPWRQRLDSAVERRILARTNAVVTVSDPIAEALAGRHGAARTHVIRNGFDPELFPGPAEIDRKKLTITYTGAVTAVRQDFSTFFEGVRRFLDDSGKPPSIELKFLGDDFTLLQKQAVSLGLRNICEFAGRRPHAEAVETMRHASANLFFIVQDPTRPGIYSAKLFEYLGARRPILAIGAVPGVAGELLRETGAGRLAGTPGEVAALLRDLDDANSAGRDAWMPDEDKVTRFSHREMAQRFAELLEAGDSGRQC